MQVSIAFAEQHTSGYPWKMNGTVRQEVFSLRGGLWFGTYHLLNYPASYSAPLYRFADFNAGWYASRNAAFQNAVVKASGVKLALDGDLIRYDSEEPGSTELAVRRLASQLGMSDSEIHRQLKRATAWRLRRPISISRFSVSPRKRRAKPCRGRCCQGSSWRVQNHPKSDDGVVCETG